MRGFNLKVAFIWFIIGINTINQCSRVFLLIALIISNSNGMENVQRSLKSVIDVSLAIFAVIDMITALSLLYLYHILGVKKRRVDKSDPELKMAALMNTDIDEEEECTGENLNRNCLPP
jgi:hypothetical protein